MGAAMGLALAAQSSLEARETVAEALAELKHALGIRQSLRDHGVAPADFPSLARNALRDPCMATNPLLPTQADIEALYEKAL
jgi:alcohol dehydrogenase class IV